MNSKLFVLTTAYAYEYTDTTIDGITPFLKSVFLAQHHADGPIAYEFTDGKYGPFSTELYDDIQQLIERGFIETTVRETTGPFGIAHEHYEYTLTSKGVSAVETGTKNPDAFEYNLLEVISVIDEYATEDTHELLERVKATAPDLFDGKLSFIGEPLPHA